MMRKKVLVKQLAAIEDLVQGAITLAVFASGPLSYVVFRREVRPGTGAALSPGGVPE